MSTRAILGSLGCVLVLLAGCLGPQLQPIHDTGELIRILPQPVKNRVHVLFLHGHDPLDLAKLSDLREYLVSLGLIKTYAGGPFHIASLADAAQESHLREPNARFVVVGHGTGCASVAALVAALHERAIPVSLAVCLGPSEKGVPPIHLADRVVSVVRSEGAGAQGETYIVATGPLGLPTHLTVQTILAQELAGVAQQVEVIEGPAPQRPFVGPWNFLDVPGPRLDCRLPIREAREMGPANELPH